MLLPLLFACHHPAPLPPPPMRPSICDADLSAWQPGAAPRSILSLSREQVGQMGASSLEAAVVRACACLEAGQGEQGTHRLRVSAKPARGTAEAVFQPTDGPLSVCVGTVEATFEGWDMPCSDAIDLSRPPDPDCAATITFPVSVALEP